MAAPTLDQPFIEPPPQAVAHKLDGVRAADEIIHIQVATDKIDDRTYGERWLVATDRHLYFIPASGADGIEQLPIDQVESAQVQQLVGGGFVEVARKEGPPTLLHYSNSLHPKFVEVAAGIGRLAGGDAPELPTIVERTRCEKCHRLLPEKDGFCPFCLSKWATFKRIASYLSPYKARVLLLMVGSAVTTALGLLPPYAIKHIIDDVLTPAAAGELGYEEGIGLLGLLVGGLLGAQLLGWGIELLTGFVRADLSAWSTRDVRAELYRNLQFLPLRFYEQRQVGSLISRFMQDSDRLEMMLLFFIPFIISNVLLFFGVFGLLLYMNWQLTLMVLAPTPFIVLASLKRFKLMRMHWGRWGTKWSRLTSHLNESIHGIRIVKAFAQEEREERRFSLRNEDLWKTAVTAERVWVVFYAVSNFVMSFGIFLVWYFGGRQILDETLTLGVLMAFISYIWQLYRPISFFTNANNMLTRSFAGAERIFEVIDATPESFANPDARPLPDLKGRVEFKDAFFGYDPGKPVLKGVDLVVEPGEMVGLVGKSGVGKSTLINLICRFYDVDRGELHIDGTDIRDLALGDLRGQIGMVAQESFLFNGSIYENISYARPEATFEEVMRAAKAANAHEFIVQKPDGYDTKVGERGDKLSGGEKQRISIARAILHDPKILILDEATSSVDTPTEQKVQEAIQRLVQGRTTFAIAHRLSTLRNADRLVVLDEGKVAEAGTHQELLDKEGIFYNLVSTQQQTTAVMAVGGGKDDESQ